MADRPVPWLEDVHGDKRSPGSASRTPRAEAELASTPQFKQLEADIRAILDSDAKIPGVEKIGDVLLQLLEGQAARARPVAPHHAGGIPQAAAAVGNGDRPRRAQRGREGKNWVWHGADCLKPEYKRCLIALSRGGSDADVTREFDLATQAVGRRTASSAPRPRAAWAGSTRTPSTSSPTSAPAR